jgi:hypothetical protein
MLALIAITFCVSLAFHNINLFGFDRFNSIIPPSCSLTCLPYGPFQSSTLSNSLKNKTDSKLRRYAPITTQKKLVSSNQSKRSGLLVILLPALNAQARLLFAALPFFLDRMMQYYPPINLVALAALSSTIGTRLLGTFLWSTATISFGSMLYDSFVLGADWSPSWSQADSFAVLFG